jgi:hypothetical protein
MAEILYPSGLATLKSMLRANSPVRRKLKQDAAVLKARLTGGLRPDPTLRWLFIFTFPNGGSTAFSDLLGSSAAARRLWSNCEGQWLIPELADVRRRMLEKPLVSSAKLRRVWMRQAGPRGGADRVVIEKSPDNMFRWRHIRDSFADMPQTSIVFTRAPLPTVASWMGRYDWSAAASGWAGRLGMPAATREDRLCILAELYLRRARALVACRETADLTLSYETLCRDPAICLRKIADLEPLLKDVDPTALLNVKDYKPRPLRNMNEQSVAKLLPEDRAVLQAYFDSTGAALLADLGYPGGEAQV